MLAGIELWGKSLQRRITVYCLISAALSSVSTLVLSDEEVRITADLPYVDVVHNGKKVRIQRNPDRGNMIDLDFALTSRECPPYCIQPMQLSPGVETIGELEVISYLQKVSAGDLKIVVIDSREEKWVKKGIIPGAIHLPWTKLFNQTATEEQVAEILQFHFGAIKLNELWNFQSAKTLVFYCNGPWCGQSPTNIRALVTLGYPPAKIKWYRGGMQSWLGFGLTTVTPE